MSWGLIFSMLAGAVSGIALLKFGNPVILDHLIEKPANWIEIIYQPWPVAWGYSFLVALVLVGLKVGRLTLKGTHWLVWTPLSWLAWQIVAATHTVDSRLTATVVTHFAACVLCFYIGRFRLSQVSNIRLFWMGLLAGMVLVLWLGFNQHYGGLEQTRRFFYEQPDWRSYPPQYLKKIGSNRIFSTLVYPNALAGALLLLMPGLSVFLWEITAGFPSIARQTITGLFAYLGLACLYWSGSRTGWLIALLLATVVLFHLPLSRLIRFSSIALLVIAGMVGFFVKHASYFERGATSVGARFDYWRAAVQTFKAHPVFGSGPGTFSVSYKRLKAAESEMALLTHNDYLEQASDSGIIGFLTYISIFPGFILLLYRERKIKLDAMLFAIWLGLLGWSLQGLTEFGLYIPALAWLAFMLLGWLAGLRHEMASTTRRATD